MKQNQLSRFAIVGVLWLSIGAGCQKDPPLPNCDNGNCCSPGTRNVFYKRVDGVLANYGGLSFKFKDPINVVNGYVLDGIPTCEAQEDMILKMKLKNNFTVVGNKVRLIDSTDQYRYRVWGIIYELPEIYNFLSVPTYSVRVEKVEEAR